MIVVRDSPPAAKVRTRARRRQFTLAGLFALVTASGLLCACLTAWWRYDLPAPMYVGAVLFGGLCHILAGGNGVAGCAVGGVLVGGVLGALDAETESAAVGGCLGGLGGAMIGLDFLALAAIARNAYRAIRPRD